MRRRSSSAKQFLEEATNLYHRSLPGSPAEHYLQTRGLGFPSLQQKMAGFKLGYVKDPLPGHEMFTGFLAIPYLRWTADKRQSVVSVRFRCIKDHEHKGHGKYMTVAGDRPRLFNTLALLSNSVDVAITEGEIDTITAEMCGVPAVGVPGVKAWQPHFREPFLGYRNVFILADGDDAGMGFAETVAATLPNAKIIPSPAGMDVNSFVSENGPRALVERMQ